MHTLANAEGLNACSSTEIHTNIIQKYLAIFDKESQSRHRLLDYCKSHFDIFSIFFFLQMAHEVSTTSTLLQRTLFTNIQT